MTEEDLRQIEIRATASDGSINDDVGALIAEVRSLRSLLDAVRLTVHADAVDENLRLNIQRALDE